MGYVGLRDHRSHRLCDVFVDKLRLDMGVEYGAEVLIRFLIGGQSRIPPSAAAFVPSATSISTETSGALAKRPPGRPSITPSGRPRGSGTERPLARFYSHDRDLNYYRGLSTRAIAAACMTLRNVSAMIGSRRHRLWWRFVFGAIS